MCLIRILVLLMSVNLLNHPQWCWWGGGRGAALSPTYWRPRLNCLKKQTKNCKFLWKILCKNFEIHHCNRNIPATPKYNMSSMEQILISMGLMILLSVLSVSYIKHKTLLKGFKIFVRGTILKFSWWRTLKSSKSVLSPPKKIIL